MPDSEVYEFIQGTVSQLQSLKGGVFLFKMLAKMQKAKLFEGTSHCEANLCALLSTDLPQGWKDIMEQLEVSRIGDIFKSIVLMFYEI